MWGSWYATVGQIVGSSAPPKIMVRRSIPVIKSAQRALAFRRMLLPLRAKEANFDAL